MHGSLVEPGMRPPQAAVIAYPADVIATIANELLHDVG
jgi:hypothetical protein